MSAERWHDEESSRPSQALVCIAPSPVSERPLAHWRRPAARFLAHLIAMRQHAPQTRERRRAEPEDAASVYAANTPRRLSAGRKVRLST